MSRCARAAFVVFACLALLPAAVHGRQGSITGVVRDPSGAVLPGVTVEATSPALIEGLRTAVTAVNDALASCQQPIEFLNARFATLIFQLDF